MTDKKNSITASELFLILLTIVFVTLKLCKVITWPWIWIFAPLWVPFSIGLIICIILFIISK